MLQQIVTTLTQDEGILLGAILGSLGILGGTVIATAAVVSQAWRRARQTEDINALKHAMIERGMSAEEIATVVRATPRRHFGFPMEMGRRHQCDRAAAVC